MMKEYNSWSVFGEGKGAFTRRVGLKILLNNAQMRFLLSNQPPVYRTMRIE